VGSSGRGKTRGTTPPHGRGQEGFDALGIVVVEMVNDGTPVKVFDRPPAPRPADVFHYDQMMHRLIHLYETAYTGLT
jgi:hypothetical protein